MVIADPARPVAAAPRTPAPIAPEEIARIRAPFRQATLLPARAYHDEAVYAWEREEIFFRDWIAVGRAEEVPEPGSFVLRDVFGENVILVRGRDDVIRAFYNVCRHRGTAVEERECGKAVRFQCPYHAWI
ncbi:MAG TPA: Rieske (2Fe-2S) protein, partial [Candidatus Limnocylindrales bacterium]|nr:Rieske (2Fe-2S) protein [Candidatus Limnocylindrales bacterium]